MVLFTDVGDIDTSTVTVQSNDGLIGLVAGNNTPGILNIGNGGILVNNATAANSEVYLYASDDVALGADVNAGLLGYVEVDAGGAITWSAGTITAADLYLWAVEGIGALTSEVNTNVTTLDAEVTGIGDIYIKEIDD